ncbi:iron-sulfur cluster-binding protein [Desulfonatronum thiosulfatophilum]|uniref:Iron-sulfur cluster-binding protein n=1 Tax=Desulfonatronum thiosulfatophilum TaxID=617002 RepID=A0A1G6EIG2_9BACT|nr:LUD domain-containing protein [Desulfonatronum thiosulfatophilum]SDB57259.1 iron-sulfur cluster-binding protein [Desulfonatronum thiosulfatophilum]
MQTAVKIEEYLQEVEDSLGNEFQRKALDTFAVAYRTGRANAFAGMDVKGLIKEIAQAKDESLARMDELYDQFKAKAESMGVHVHLAATAEEANQIVARIARENKCKKVIKAKSMTAEETHLNHHLEEQGLKVVESDLGEWIIQMRGEGPSHMVMPAIHLSRYQVADLFAGVTKKEQEPDIQKLVKVARRELRKEYVEADMGISGSNFAVAETGTIGLVTNEGNARLVTTLPKVHVALIGLEKLTPTLHDALRILRGLPRNATGQQITSYVTWITGANECHSAPENKKIMHVIFLDNGRKALAKDKDFSQILRCIRCGACANVCPVYRLVGGHKYGHVYIGAIGLIMTYFFHGKDKAKFLVQNCVNCGACKEVCASGIDLPRLIKEIHARIQDEDGHPTSSKLLGTVLKNRTMFHTLLKNMRWAQKPFAEREGQYIRHLPTIFIKGQDFRKLPTIADKPFRDEWESIKPVVAKPELKVALFSGCVQDFVYPEQMKAAVKVIASTGKVALDYPMKQSCCGLPVNMMGEKQTAIDVARQNVAAFDPLQYDYIMTMCASCASHLKHGYPKLLENETEMTAKVAQFADKVIDFSSFVHDVLKISSMKFARSDQKVGYHAPCHLCRGLEVRDAPRENLDMVCEYVPTTEEEVCCGFGGSYSMKFPAISKTLLAKKLADLEAGNITAVGTDCPGCVMQIRGGMKAADKPIEVKHIAELMAERLR